jgi:hypothetical protein
MMPCGGVADYWPKQTLSPTYVEHTRTDGAAWRRPASLRRVGALLDAAGAANRRDAFLRVALTNLGS